MNDDRRSRDSGDGPRRSGGQRSGGSGSRQGGGSGGQRGRGGSGGQRGSGGKGRGDGQRGGGQGRSGGSGRGDGKGRAGGQRGRDPDRAGGQKGRGRDSQAGRGRSSGKDQGGRSGGQSRGGREEGGERRTRSAAHALTRGSVELPHWVRDALVRVTPKSRVADAIRALEEAAGAFVQGRYRRALARAETAKSLSPRDATVRELIGLSAYRMGRWDTALKELRNYRRLAGDTTHLPIEMDVLRALRRPADVEATWSTLQELGANPATMKEGKVVYAAFLLDQGEPRAAWDVARPKRIVDEPFEEDLRQWFVAARAAVALGDHGTAQQLRDAIVGNDPAFPGLEELDSAIGQ